MFASSLMLRIVLVVLAVSLLWALFAGETGASGPERQYRVKPGDTLWSIAERTFAGRSHAKGCGSSASGTSSSSAVIVPGQVLVLPA